MDPIGTVIGNYRIEAPLGAGGTGQIFRAVHVHLGRTVALKILHPQYAADVGFQARFVQEAQSAAALRHPNIVEILDFGQDGGSYYLVMELVLDGSVRTLLRARPSRDVPLDLTLSLDLVRQAAEGLGFAHRNGMVHRDVKPDNLLLRAREPSGFTIKVTDFGLARLAEGGVQTLSGTTMGTPVYMSPEQCQGSDLDGRSDLYSLGVTLYELCTGYVPFQARTLSDAVFKHVNTPPPSPREVRPELPPELERIILTCLAKSPAERYATAEELIAALGALGGGLGIVTVASPREELITATVLGLPERVTILPRRDTEAFNPGVAAVVGVTLANPGRQEIRARLAVEGMPAGWLTVPGEVNLPPGSQREAAIGVLVPRDPSSTAGKYPVTLRAWSGDDPASGMTAKVRWTVLPYSTGSLGIQPERGGWRLTLAINGNARTRFGLHASDDGNLLEYSITPPALELAPGERGQAMVRARPRGEEISEAVPFLVEARAGDGPPLTALGTFRPGGHGVGAPLWPLAVAGLVVVLLTGFIFLMMRDGGNDNPATATAALAQTAATATTEMAQVEPTVTDAPVSTATSAPIVATATVPIVIPATATAADPTATFTVTPTATATPTPAPRYPSGLTVWRAAGGFTGWQLTGVNRTLEGALQLDPVSSTSVPGSAGRYLGGNYLLGEALGPETPAEPFTRLVASWNAFTPPGAGIEVLVSVRIGERWTAEYSLGIWTEYADGGLRKSVAGQADADGEVDIDTLVVYTPANAYRLTVRLLNFSGDALPRVVNLSAATYPTPANPAALEPGDPARWDRTLDVPVCTSNHTPRDDSSGTSVAMVLAYWDGAPNDCASRVAAAAEGVFDFVYQGTGNWPFGTAYAVASHPTFEGYVVRFPNLAEAERWIAAGVPVVVSTEGRLAVLAGFAANGDVVVNEAGVESDGAPRVTYPREAFERAWFSTSGGIAYLIYPAGTNVPTQ